MRSPATHPALTRTGHPAHLRPLRALEAREIEGGEPFTATLIYLAVWAWSVYDAGRRLANWDANRRAN